MLSKDNTAMDLSKLSKQELNEFQEKSNQEFTIIKSFKYVYWEDNCFCSVMKLDADTIVINYDTFMNIHFKN